MPTVNIDLKDIFESGFKRTISFRSTSAPYVKGQSLVSSEVREVPTDADGLATITLQPGNYEVTFAAFSNKDKLIIGVPDDDQTYPLTALINAGTTVPIPPVYQGQAATVEIAETITGEPMTDAIVENVGNENAARLRFTIPRGDRGWRGFRGYAATVAIGDVETVAPGEDAEVINTGNAHDAVFDFKIPKGNTGDIATIEVGSVTTGAPGSDAIVSNSGTSEAAVLDFEIPRGDTGAAATIAVGTVTTGAAGSSAAVTNSGTSGAATFNFTIPRGNTGATGNIALVAAYDATGDITLPNSSTWHQIINPNGAQRNVTLPVIAVAPVGDQVAIGWSQKIENSGASGLALIVKNSAGIEQARIENGSVALFIARGAPGLWTVHHEPENQPFVKHFYGIDLKQANGTVIDLFTVPTGLRYIVESACVILTGYNGSGSPVVSLIESSAGVAITGNQTVTASTVGRCIVFYPSSSFPAVAPGNKVQFKIVTASAATEYTVNLSVNGYYIPA